MHIIRFQHLKIGHNAEQTSGSSRPRRLKASLHIPNKIALNKASCSNKRQLCLPLEQTKNAISVTSFIHGLDFVIAMFFLNACKFVNFP